MARRNNKPFDEARTERLQQALGSAHEIVLCIHGLAWEYQDHANNKSCDCFVATEHLARLACRYLDQVYVEIFQAPGYGSFEKEFKKLGAGWHKR